MMFKFASRRGNFPMLYCCKDWNFFGANFLFVFGALQILSSNIRSFLSLGLESSISPNIRNIIRVGLFHFLSVESYFLKYKFFKVSVWWNLRKFRLLKYNEVSQSFRFLKCKKSFILRKCKKFLNIRARKFHYPKYKDLFSRWSFYIFRVWA